MQLPTAKRVREVGDVAIGGTLIAVFLAASLMADLYGVSVVMDTTYSTINQMLIAVGCVTVKAFGLIKMRQAWRYGCRPSAVAMGLLTGLVVIVSITNEMTYYSTNFLSKAKRLGNDVAIAADIAKEKAEIEDRIAKAGIIRPIAAIQADITLDLARPIKDGRREGTLDQLTKGCLNTKSWAYYLCNHVLALRSELSIATSLTPQLERDRARLEVIRDTKSWVTTVGEASPGAGFWVRSYNRFIDWRGYGEEHHITAQDGQDFLVVICMLVLQMLNLFLPFAWFWDDAKAVPNADANALVRKTMVGKPANDEPAATGDWHSLNRWLLAEMAVATMGSSAFANRQSPDSVRPPDFRMHAENRVLHVESKQQADERVAKARQPTSANESGPHNGVAMGRQVVGDGGTDQSAKGSQQQPTKEERRPAAALHPTTATIELPRSSAGLPAPFISEDDAAARFRVWLLEFGLEQINRGHDDLIASADLWSIAQGFGEANGFRIRSHDHFFEELRKLPGVHKETDRRVTRLHGARQKRVAYSFRPVNVVNRKAVAC